MISWPGFSATQVSPAIILITRGAPEGGMLQSWLFTSRSQNLVSGKLRRSGFWRYSQFFKWNRVKKYKNGQKIVEIASALMLSMLLLSIHSFLQLTDAQQGRGISPFLCYGYGHITVMIMFTLASKLIRVQLKISGHHRSRDCDPPLHSSFLIRGGVSPALLCLGDGCSEVVQWPMSYVIPWWILSLSRLKGTGQYGGS